MSAETERSDAIKELYKLWSADNAVANQKLAMYFVIQGVIVNALGTLSEFCSIVPWVGIIVSVIWIISMARTQAYREYWKTSILQLSNDEAHKYLALLPSKENEIKWYGRVPSGVVLVGSPILGLFLWVVYLCDLI